LTPPAGVEPRPKATLTVLVVDDSLTVREAVREAFAADEEVRVVACGDVDSAELVLAEECPDVVLCDVVLPGRSGYELCATLSRRTGRQGPPVLLLTGAFEPFDAGRAKESGADAVISKPFTPEELRNAVEQALRAAGQPARPPDPGGIGREPARGEASVVSGRPGDGARRYPEITEDDLVGPSPSDPDGTDTPTDRLARRLVEPLSRRLAEPVAANLAGRLLDDEALREMVRSAVQEAAERLVRRRLEEIETGASAAPEPEPGDDTG
jgi:CheY-like chemotaxis protein